MDKYLVVVESPTKAKTIRKFLPKNYIIEASMGHIRDLPQSAADIPKDLKQEAWSKIGVNVEKDFEPLYIVPKGKSKVVRELKKTLKDVKCLYLATDEDREGESISWHLVELLRPKVPVKRMVFHEITKAAINRALENCRQIDIKLVRAQETRRILDRLYGYTLSPLIWKKIAYGLSAGRVQSTGLKLLVEREKQRVLFEKSEYWDIKSSLGHGAEQKKFEAKILSFQSQRVAASRDYDSVTGKMLNNKNVLVLSRDKANEIANEIKNLAWKVLSVEEKKSSSKPSIPFITSTLQQEGNRKLGLSAKDTMRTAQRLYEEGLITYMRTDSPNLSQEAINGARKSVEKLYGKEYLHHTSRQYSTKSKTAQEAHEAIRPAGQDFTHPQDTGLSGKERALYELIWKRTLASQMAEAQKVTMSVRIGVGDCVFAASGTRITFPGFLRVYVEGKDDPDQALEDKEVLLPQLKEGDQLKPHSVLPQPHETKPPARFTEASLVQRLEKEGVGRPSTYATIIGTITDRGYARKIGNALIPSFTGFAVAQLLDQHFSDLVDYSFTSSMENSLDEIAMGEQDWLVYLKNFYLGSKGLKKKVEEREKKIKPEESRTLSLPQLQGTVEVKVGRYGPYIVAGGQGKDEIHASIPEDIAPADLTSADIKELLEISKKGPEPIGKHPESGENIYCLVGRYGPYVQLGEVSEQNPKPRRASLPNGVGPREIGVDMAVRLLLLPRDLGLHPESGKPVVANNGRFGPYIVHDGDFRSLKKDDDVYEIKMDRALELLSEEKKSRRGAAVLVDFSKEKGVKKKLQVLDGKFGPYIKDGAKNFTLPEQYKDKEEAKKILLDQALEIIGENKKSKKKAVVKKKTKTAKKSQKTAEKIDTRPKRVIRKRKKASKK